MAKITYDEKSFLIDNKRIWLVSGAIHYSRTPRAQWRQRICAAKEAGLNCIETYVFWNLHEPEPGTFDFEGEKDLRRFVQMIGEQGMYCILRPGPFICAEWDNGGIPAWLGKEKNIKLRQANEPFLKASARYLKNVLEQVKDLQVAHIDYKKSYSALLGNKPGQPGGGFVQGDSKETGGPIILMQAENEWVCHNPEQGEKYLLKLVRYLREYGCAVPINVCNQLLQRVEGTIDSWNASANLAASIRQLGVIQQGAPRLVTEYWPGWFDAWDKKHSDTVNPGKHLYRMASILAAGGQYNMYMFHGGTNFGFYGGRTIGGNPSNFMTTSYDYDAPLLEAGGRGDKYKATKRISTFASQFTTLLANLNQQDQPAAIALNETDHPFSVIHRRGEYGSVIFIFRSEKDKQTDTEILLPNGLTLPVNLGKARAGWFLLDVKLGEAKLDYSNLQPWCFLENKMLVLFGAADSQGVVSINNSHLEVTVPKGYKPVLKEHEGITLIILNQQQVDDSYIYDKGVALWCAGLDSKSRPIALNSKNKKLALITTDGKVLAPKDYTPSTKKPTAPKLTNWSHLSVDSLIDGTAGQYESIDSASSLDKLGQNFGYGWYKFSLAKSKHKQIISPLAQDRLHIYKQGKLKCIVGEGAGAKEAPVNLDIDGKVIALVDNLGRMNFGYRVGEQKGILNNFYSAKAIELKKPKIIEQKSPDPFEISGFVTYKQKGNRPPAQALVWDIKPAGQKPILLEVRDFPLDAVVEINNRPVANYSKRYSSGRLQVVLDPKQEHVSFGKNEIKISLYGQLDKKLDLTKYIKAYHLTSNLTARSKWEFCPFKEPNEKELKQFKKLPKKVSANPHWFKSDFSIKNKSTALWLEPIGMSKGQIYLNGHNVGRYWVNTASGKKVIPQEKYYLPEAWLKENEQNQLLLFDEHGKMPTKARLCYDSMGPYN